MLSAGDCCGLGMPEDKWDDSSHTELENVMAKSIKQLVWKAFTSNSERADFARSFPLLWGDK
jgi:hypothetical protein